MDAKSKPVDILIAVAAALIVIAVAAFLLLRNDHEARRGSQTYANLEHGAMVRYFPPGGAKPNVLVVGQAVDHIDAVAPTVPSFGFVELRD